jgi:hypothetical protein
MEFRGAEEDELEFTESDDVKDAMERVPSVALFASAG